MSDYLSMIPLVFGDPAFVAKWAEGCRRMQSEHEQWIASLRARGIKAAHPNDGWVDRHNNTVEFVYPHFDDGATTGDLVMLGWHGSNGYLRLIRLTEEVTTWSRVKRFRFVDCQEGPTEGKGD